MSTKIADNCIVSINYTLTDENNDILDTSENSEPLRYLHGAGNIVAGLESELTGREVGEKFDAVIPPEEAYGIYRDELIETVSIELFEGIDNLVVGMQVQTQAQEGTQTLTITEIEEGNVTVNGNHPMAGKALYFAISVMDIVEATAEEIQNGHVH